MGRLIRIVILLAVPSIVSCAFIKPSSHGGHSGGQSVFSGRVTDQHAGPIEGARVKVNDTAILTRADGSFQVEVPGAARYILGISHPDYADLSFIARTPLQGQRWSLIRAQVETVDPRNAITIADHRPDLVPKHLAGATVSVPANALVDHLGHAPVGPVRAAIATLDVANGEGPGDWAARSDDGTQEAYLVSYGAVFVQFTDVTGILRYQLRSGTKAQLVLPVTPKMLAHAPGSPNARFWYYDSKDGYWKHTGDAVFDAATGTYRGEVAHLSTLNTDIAKTNAACLKITLDPSIAPGMKLRIRYHSGGTAFGQSPTFVMNDTDNAVYRLPADTNVLLELLDTSDQVFGNLVVEDPVGTALVNTVVNTGAQIPAGHTFWPPPPYTDCKPTRLRLGLPQVEIRINELATDAATLRDDPTDDYITWAPTFCRARLATPGMPVTVVLTNDPAANIADGGDARFAAFQDPWPVNTTATNDTVTLSLPGDGSYVPFVIAGKFGKPSTNDKDTIVEAHLGTAAGPVVGSRALMVRVRKNANVLTASERARFLFALRNFRKKLGTNYVLLQEMHRLAQSIANDQGHKQPAFLPWHRAMLLQVERELQAIDPSVALHYWDWDHAAPNVFSADFMGGSDGSSGFSTAEPIFSVTNPLNGWNTDLPFQGGEIWRNTDDHTVVAAPGTFKPLDNPPDPSLVDDADYGPRSVSTSFSYECERLAHDQAHGWPCGGGHLAFPVRSAADPLFYLLHSQVEREWAYWQQKKNRFGVIAGGLLTFPAPTHYDNNGNWNDPGVVLWYRGAFLEDGMWPWDGTTGGTGRAQRPPNHATGPGTNVPLSTPAVPMTPFPASTHKNLWPAAPAIPRPRDMIDYEGRFQPALGLGFSYDDVPY